jgi:hypothetical protein
MQNEMIGGGESIIKGLCNLRAAHVKYMWTAIHALSFWTDPAAARVFVVVIAVMRHYYNQHNRHECKGAEKGHAGLR